MSVHRTHTSNLTIPHYHNKCLGSEPIINRHFFMQLSMQLPVPINGAETA